MKRYFRTITLVLVGVLLLASCGAMPAATGEASMEERWSKHQRCKRPAW